MNLWRRAGLLRRVATLAAVVVLVVLAVLGIAITAAADARHAINLRSDRLGPASTTAVEVLADITDEETGVRGLLVTHDPSFLSPYRTAQDRLPGQFDHLRTLLRDEPALLVDLERVRIDHDSWVRNVAVREIDDANRGDFAAAATFELSGQGRVRFDIVRSDLEQLQEGIGAARDRESRNLSRAQEVLFAALLAAVVLVLALTGAVTLAVSRWLIRPFQKVGSAVDAVAAGDLQTEVPSTGPREVADLGASVEAMRSRLVTSLDESRRAVEALTQQGPAVIALRDALAPSCTASTELVVAGRLDPAEGVLAGDWYDTLDLPNGRVGLVVGDVSGHGPGPGVFALRLKHLLAAALATGMSPSMSVEWVVAQLGDTGEMFATALVVVIDPASGLLEFVNAGHPEAVLIRGPSSRLLRMPASGPILSRVVFSPGAWTSRQMTLEPGDVLLAYTDGLVEARRDGEQLGTTGLFEHLSSLTGASRPPTPQRLLDDVFSFVHRFSTGPAADDRSAVALSRALPTAEQASSDGSTRRAAGASPAAT